MADESHKERIDRELIELLNEIRVALPGVQVLFAFLLIVPFSNGYTNLTAFQKDVFFATFISTAFASAFLIAPTANHRIQFRQKDKERLLIRANRQAIAGTVLLALAITGTVFLITDFVFTRVGASAAAAAFALFTSWLWYVVPTWRRVTGPGERSTT